MKHRIWQQAKRDMDAVFQTDDTCMRSSDIYSSSLTITLVRYSLDVSNVYTTYLGGPGHRRSALLHHAQEQCHLDDIVVGSGPYFRYTVLSSVYMLSPCRLSSEPIPDCFQPPIGMSSARNGTEQLTPTAPACRDLATRIARSKSLVYTDAGDGHVSFVPLRIDRKMDGWPYRTSRNQHSWLRPARPPHLQRC